MAAKKKAAKKRGKKPAARHARRDSRAREKSSKAQRVQRCIELMAAGQWRTGITGHDVAKEFGVSPATVKTDAAEASRTLRQQFDDQDLEEKKAQLLATLETATAMAKAGGSARELRECVMSQLEALGLGARKGHDVRLETNIADILGPILDEGPGEEAP